MTDKTDELLASRRAVYGDRVENMKRTAQMWSGFLGFQIEPWQVSEMFSMYKAFRMTQAPDYSDNIDDKEGWARMTREVLEATVGVVQARTVEEYLEKKSQRDMGNRSEEHLAGIDEGLRIAEALRAREAQKNQLGERIAETKPRHPYENVERDAERDAMEAYLASDQAVRDGLG